MHGLRLALGLLPFLLSMAATSAGDNSDPPADDADTDDATGTNGGNGTVSYDQAAFDRALTARLVRERRKLRGEVEAELRQEWEAEQQRNRQEEAEEYRPLYEAEKAARENAERSVETITSNFRNRLARVEIEKAAAESNLVEPDLAYRLIDFEQIDFNDDDEPTNVVALVKQLATDRPGLVRAESGRNGINGVPDSESSSVTRQDRIDKFLEQAGAKPR